MRLPYILAAVVSAIIITSGAFLYFTGPEEEKPQQQASGHVEDAPIISAYFKSNIEMHEKFPTDARIVFVGDSRMHQPHWEDLFPRASVGNRGISGDTFYGLLKRVHHLGIRKPDVMVLELGVNDVLMGYELDTIRSNADAVFAQLKPQAGRLVVLDVMDCRGEGCDREKVAAVNLYLKTLSDKSGAQFVELNSRLADPEGLREDFSLDGVHLNAAGYSELVGILCTQVQELACAQGAEGQSSSPAQ